MPVEKFLFETTFDPGTDYTEKDAEDQDNQDSHKFTQEDLDAARKEGFASGQENGIKESAESDDKHVADAMAEIQVQLKQLLEAQGEANSGAMQSALMVAVSITRKLFPYLEERVGLQEVERLVESTLSRLMDEPRIVVRVNMKMHELLEPSIDELSTRLGYEGQVVLLPDDSLKAGDCQVTWIDGSARRDPMEMWREIDAIIENHMGPDAVDWTKPPTVEDDMEDLGDESAVEVDNTGDLFEWERAADPNKAIDRTLDTRDNS